MLAAALVLFLACEKPASSPDVKTGMGDQSIDQRHNLGWLGGYACPLNKPVATLDPANADSSATSGGMVIVDVTAGMPLDSAQLKPGDVIVRIGDSWLPIKEDPTLDLIKAVEDQISARKNTIEVGYHRNGNFGTTGIQTDLESIDEGLPLPVARIIDLSVATLKHLATLQRDDGSFQSASDDHHANLIVTSIAGLAFLSADPSVEDAFAGPVRGCLNSVGQQLDRLVSQGEDSGLDPLAAAYVALFLSESDIELQDETWLERIGVVLESMTANQHESGGWNLSGPEPADEEIADASSTKTVDVPAMFSTNQILLALGALERKGLSIENSIIENGMKWLNGQSKLRIQSDIDRRVKALLSAGSAAALMVLNCDRNDLQLKELRKDSLDRAHDVYTAPQLGLPGLVMTAIAARQADNESWLLFHDSVKHLELSLIRPDGSVIGWPNVERDPLDFETAVAGQAWTTAHVGLLLSMQSQSLEKLMAANTPDAMIVRDSSGKELQDSPGTEAMQLDGAQSADAEALKKMIMERLKEQGMDVDESKLKIKTVESTDDD